MWVRGIIKTGNSVVICMWVRGIIKTGNSVVICMWVRGQRSYVCELGVSNLPLSVILIFDFRIVWTVRYFFLVHCIIANIVQYVILVASEGEIWSYFYNTRQQHRIHLFDSWHMFLEIDRYPPHDFGWIHLCKVSCQDYSLLCKLQYEQFFQHKQL